VTNASPSLPQDLWEHQDENEYPSCNAHLIEKSLHNCLLAWNQWRRNMISGEVEPILMDFVSDAGCFNTSVNNKTPHTYNPKSDDDTGVVGVLFESRPNRVPLRS
jgi:hypothetical protein